MGNRGTMVNGKVGFNHYGFLNAVSELPVTLMDRRAVIEHEANLVYRGIVSPECKLTKEPVTIGEANDYWMEQDMVGLATRWLKVDNVMIWLSDKGGYFVSYYNTASHHQKLATTSKSWGEALVQAIKEYKDYWKDTYLEPYHYYHIASMINFYCEDATPKKQSPKQEEEHETQLCARLKPVSEADWIIRYEPITTTSNLVTKEYNGTEVTTAVYETTPSGPIYKERSKPVTNEDWIVEEFVVNEDGTETIRKHYTIENKLLKDWRQGFMRRRKKYAKKHRKNNRKSVTNKLYPPMVDNDKYISDDDIDAVFETITPPSDQSYIEYETSTNHDVYLKNAYYEQLKNVKIDNDTYEQELNSKDINDENDNNGMSTEEAAFKRSKEYARELRKELYEYYEKLGLDPIFWRAITDIVMKDNVFYINRYIKDKVKKEVVKKA